MADYHCHPLWGTTPEDLGDISPEELPISPELKHSLRKWAERYDAILNMDDPISSGFKNEREEKQFIDDGYKDSSIEILSTALQQLPLDILENIQVIHQINQGVSAARNAGSKNTRPICYFFRLR